MAAASGGAMDGSFVGPLYQPAESGDRLSSALNKTLEFSRRADDGALVGDQELTVVVTRD